MTTEKSISLPGILKIFQLFSTAIFSAPLRIGDGYIPILRCVVLVAIMFFVLGVKCKNNFYMKKDNIALGLIKHIIWTNFEG